MKPVYCFMALMSFCLINTAHSAVLLEKVTSPGYVMPSYSISSNCSINDNGQLITQYQLGEMVSKSNQVVQLSLLSIRKQINSAALGTINSEIFPVDVKTIIYRAYQKQNNGTLKTVLLYEENGGSGQKRINNEQSAIALRNFIDLHCK